MGLFGIRFSIRQYVLGFLTLLALILCITYLSKNPVPAGDTPLRQATQITDTTGNLLTKQWSYMPGVSRDDGMLTVRPTTLALVNQDGSGGQHNPPVNVYGTHLEQVNEFSISGTIDKLQNKAIVQLYGSTPIIADEFRIERKSIRLSVSKTVAQVEVWAGNNQGPVISQTYAIEQADSYAFSIKHQSGSITLTINGKTLGNVPARDIFATNEVWFGLDATAGWRLSKLQADALGASPLVIADSSTLTATRRSTDGIQGLASAKREGFKVGAAMALEPAATDKEYAEVAFGGNFGALTTENALKWQAVHPQPGTYTFQQGDALVALARKHGMSVHGHTLVFGEANPRWVQKLPTTTQAEKDKVKEVMTQHISKVMGHYKGKISSWDVVNEPLADYDQFESGTIMRQHKWQQAMGDSYIATAFKEAHTVDPNAQLFMNEFGLEEEGERWDAFLKLVTSLKAQGVPIDGVGFQAHVYEEADAVDIATLRKHIQILAKLGLKSRISEIDVLSDKGTTLQATQYANVLKACIDEPSCIAYTTWGVSDRYDTFKDDDGSIQYGQDYLWNADMQPTPAVARMKDILN